MATLKDMDGFHTYGWMVNHLQLEGGDLTAFALVYAFTKGHAGEYLGNTAYLSSWTGWSERTSRSHLANLVDRGLLVEIRGRENNVPFCHYRLAPDFYEKHPVKISGSPGKNFPDHPEKISVGPGKNFREEENNIEENILEEKNISIPPYPPTKSSAFSLRSELIAAGVSADVADAWLAVRKAKRAVNTEVAWRAIEREISRSGRSAGECIRFAAERSWAGFKAEWLNEENTRRATPAAPSNQKGNYVLDAMKGLDQLQGTNYYEQYMAAKNGITFPKIDIDEQ